MQKIAVAGTLLLGLCGLFTMLCGADSVIGIVKEKPEGTNGIWKINDRSVEVDEGTEFSADFGPVEMGACVKVSYDEVVAETIESRPENRCR
jgi:hypothetical protein